jgi:hypothetical protein
MSTTETDNKSLELAKKLDEGITQTVVANATQPGSIGALLQKEGIAPEEVKGKAARTMWSGALHVNIPDIGITDQTYQVKFAKVATDLAMPETKKLWIPSEEALKAAKEENKYVEVESHQLEVVYAIDPVTKERKEVPHELVSTNVVYVANEKATPQPILIQKETRNFAVRTDVTPEGKEERYILYGQPIPDAEVKEFEVVNGMIGDEAQLFYGKPEIMEITDEDYVKLQRTAEYKFAEIYQMGPVVDKKKKVFEDPNRIKLLAQTLLEHRTALVFFWTNGFYKGSKIYYTGVLYPYVREEDGKMWLFFGTAEGAVKPDTSWAVDAWKGAVADAPTARMAKRPKLSK